MRVLTGVAAVAAAVVSSPLAAAQFPPSPPRTTERPVVGVLSIPLTDSGDCVTLSGTVSLEGNEKSDEASCFDNIYVKWIEAAGARVVPIRYDSLTADLDKLFNSLNAILFTGGGTDITDLSSPYMSAAGHLLNASIAAFVNDGDHVPVWGTCMGIQTLSALIAQNASVVEPGYVGVDPLMMPLNLTAAASSSTMFGSLPEVVRSSLDTKPITTNLHHEGVAPSQFTTDDHLSAFFNVLSTNTDTAGREFVSTIEGKTVPVYGVQWHPERPQFEWHKIDPVTGLDPINHDSLTVYAMQSFANFFVSEVRFTVNTNLGLTRSLLRYCHLTLSRCLFRHGATITPSRLRTTWLLS